MGAEEVLARLHHETRPTPSRTAASGIQTLRLDKGELVAATEKEWTPKSMMAVIDGADAKWAFILVTIREEADVEKYIDWYKAKAKLRPNALQQVHDYWWACAWRIALAMRLNKTFAEVTTEIMQEVTAFQEAVLLPAQNAWRQRRPQLERLHRDGRSRHRTSSQERRQLQGQGQGQGQRQAEHVEKNANGTTNRTTSGGRSQMVDW